MIFCFTCLTVHLFLIFVVNNKPKLKTVPPQLISLLEAILDLHTERQLPVVTLS